MLVHIETFIPDARCDSKLQLMLDQHDHFFNTNLSTHFDCRLLETYHGANVSYFYLPLVATTFEW